MSTIVRGVHYDIGNRELYEDRVTSLHLETAGELQIDVAIVADGVGGENRGERAAQVAIDACVEFLQNSTITDLAVLISNAAQAANVAVNQIFQELDGASTTISIAIVHAGRLYIANVGDSRIYLMRDSTLTQLTLDHTFENLVPIQGKMSIEKARNYPSAHVIMRALGPKSQIPIDIGFHFETKNILTREAYMRAQEAGQSGLALEHGDSILICSDGLIREVKATGEPSTSNEEIIQVLSSQAGEKAARSLVSFALGRDSDDNISVAVLQNLDEDELRARESATERQVTSFRRFMIFSGVSLLVLLVFSIIGAVVFYRTLIGRDEVANQLEADNTRTQLELEEARQAQETIAAENQRIIETSDAATLSAQLFGEATQTVQAIIAATETSRPTSTPTPTATPRPILKENQIGGYFLGRNSNPIDLFENDIVTANQRIEFQINHTEEDLPNGSIFGFPSTEIEFKRVGTRLEFELIEGSQVFIESGRYDSGTEIDLFPDNISFLLQGSCMSVDYDTTEEEVRTDCYSGTCRYQIGRDPAQVIPIGQSLIIDLSSADLEQTTSDISEDRTAQYESLLIQSTDGQADADACLLRYLPPTPQPTATPTIFVPTRTVIPTATNTPTSTSTPRPSTGQSNPVGNSGEPIVNLTPTSTNTPRVFVTTSGVPFPTSTPSRTRFATPTEVPPNTSTPTRTRTPRPTSTNTIVALATSTNTPIPPTNTTTATISPTQTSPPNTSTPLPTSTNTPASPTARAVEPQNTNVISIVTILFSSLFFGLATFPIRARKGTSED